MVCIVDFIVGLRVWNIELAGYKAARDEAQALCGIQVSCLFLPVVALMLRMGSELPPLLWRFNFQLLGR